MGFCIKRLECVDFDGAVIKCQANMGHNYECFMDEAGAEMRKSERHIKGVCQHLLTMEEERLTQRVFIDNKVYQVMVEVKLVS